MWLADSNILIRAASAIDHPLQAWLQDQLPAISVVTRIEALGFHRLRADEEIALRLLLSSFDEYPITLRIAAGLLSCAASEKCRSAMRLSPQPAWNTGKPPGACRTPPRQTNLSPR